MREDFRIFVEGVADKRFLEQLIGHYFGEVKDDSIVITGGYTSLLSEKTGNAYLNQMKRTSDDGGVNLVVFDADDNCEKRRAELLAWKEKVGAEFEFYQSFGVQIYWGLLFLEAARAVRPYFFLSL